MGLIDLLFQAGQPFNNVIKRQDLTIEHQGVQHRLIILPQRIKQRGIWDQPQFPCQTTIVMAEAATKESFLDIQHIPQQRDIIQSLVTDIMVSKPCQIVPMPRQPLSTLTQSRAVAFNMNE